MSCLAFLTEEQRAQLAGVECRDAAEVIAEHPVPPVTAGVLHRISLLAQDARPGIRASAAAHRHATAELLATLALDPVDAVRACVARNPGAPPEVLGVLAADSDATVRGWGAANPSVTPELLSRLGEDDDATVRAVVGWSQAWGADSAEPPAVREPVGTAG